MAYSHKADAAAKPDFGVICEHYVDELFKLEIALLLPLVPTPTVGPSHNKAAFRSLFAALLTVEFLWVLSNDQIKMVYS